MATATDTFLAEALARRQKAMEALQPQKPKIQDLVTEEPIEMKKSVLDAGQRAESAGLVTNEQKKKHLEAVGYKPELIGELNGKVGVYNPEDTRQFFPIDPQGLEAGDVTELWRKGLVSGSQILGAGTAGALGLPSGPGAIATAAAGAGIAGGATEAAAQKFTIEQLKKKYPGYDFGKVSGGEVALEALAGAGGEVLGAGLGLASKSLKNAPMKQAIKKAGKENVVKVVGQYGDDVVKKLKPNTIKSLAQTDDVLKQAKLIEADNPKALKSFNKALYKKTGQEYDSSIKELISHEDVGSETLEYLSGGKADDALFAHAKKLAKEKRLNELDFDPRSGAARFDERKLAIADKKIFPGIKEAEKMAGKLYKEAVDNIPEATRNTPVNITDVVKDIETTLDERGLVKEALKVNKYGQATKDIDWASSSGGIGKLKKVYEKLTSEPNMSVEKLRQIKTNLGDSVNWEALHGMSNESATAYDAMGSKLYGKLSNKINDILDLSDANKQFSKTRRVLDSVRPYLKERRIERLLDRMSKNPDNLGFILKKFKELNDVVPEPYKFMEPLMNAQTSKMLSDFGFTGSSAGSAKSMLQRTLFTPGLMGRGAVIKSQLGQTVSPVAKPIAKGIKAIASPILKNAPDVLKPAITREMLKPAFQNNQISIQDLIKQKREQANVTA